MPLPAAADFNGSSVTEAQFKTAMANLLDWLSTEGHLGVGSVIFTAKSTPPTGFLKANGAAISRTTYSALFAAIGTTFGAGNGVTTFNVPDLRGEFVRGWDDARGVDSGRVFGSAQGSANLSHTHSTDSQGTHSHSVTAAVFMNNYGYTGSENGNVFGGSSTGSAGAHTHTALASGGTEARPRNIALLACIKY